MKLKEAFEKSTGKPFELIHGKGTCFRAGNKVAIQKTTWDEDKKEEACRETVAEIWPAGGSKDKIDGALMVHCYNHFQEVVAALEKAVEKNPDWVSKETRNLLIKVNNVRV
jgi:hypothetical protein